MAQAPGSTTVMTTHSPGDNYVTEFWVLCTLFPSLATIAVVLRFWARHLKGVDLWWDDWTAALALFLAWAFYGCAAFGMPSGGGRHIEFVSKEGQRLYLISFFCYQTVYVVLPPTIKMSALFLYKRIFISPKMAIVFNSLIGLLTAWALMAVLISVFGCTPVSAAWNGGGHCSFVRAWLLGYGIPNILLDIVVWGLPIPKVWALQLPTKQKLALSGIFAMGLIDCALAIMRLAFTARNLGKPDFTYNDTPTIWWTLIHTSLGIIVISLPTMRVLLVKFWPTCWKNSVSTASGRGSKTTPAYKAFWRAKNWHRMELPLSGSGENDEGLHNNTIAMAVRPDSTTAIIAPVDGIHVVREFTVESQRRSAVATRERSPGLQKWSLHDHRGRDQISATRPGIRHEARRKGGHEDDRRLLNPTFSSCI